MIEGETERHFFTAERAEPAENYRDTGNLLRVTTELRSHALNN